MPPVTMMAQWKRSKRRSSYSGFEAGSTQRAHDRRSSLNWEELLRLDYEQVNENFRLLTDIRFRLLTLVPTIAGGGIALLSAKFLGSEAPQPMLLCLLGAFGFLVTLGIVVYDLRNSQIYGALIHRAKYLERRMRMFPRYGERYGDETGGMFTQRIPAFGRFVVRIQHDSGLSLIYGTVLGGWIFLITKGLLVGLGTPLVSRVSWLRLSGDGSTTTIVAGLAALVAVTVAILALRRSDVPAMVNLTGYPDERTPHWRSICPDCQRTIFDGVANAVWRSRWRSRRIKPQVPERYRGERTGGDA